MRVLRDPSAGGLHLPWIESVRDRIAGLPLGPALALVAPRGYIPDFITPPPTSPVVEVADELARLRRTPPEQVRIEVERFLRVQRRRSAGVLAGFLEQPRRAVHELADAYQAYWDVALAEHWPRIRAMLQGDVAYRGARLAEGGLERLFGDVHPTVSFGAGALSIEMPWEQEVALGGRGLLLVASAFAWSHPAVMIERPWQPTMTYPARGIATIWDPGASAPDGLERLVGPTRAGMLSVLDHPRSTTDLARILEVTPGAVSQHLGVLRSAGLVTARREGRAVLSVRTPAADQLVSSSSS